MENIVSDEVHGTMQVQKSTSQELLRLAVHAAPAGIIIANRNGSIVFANQTLLDMFGYHERELLGQAVEVLVPDAATGAQRIGCGAGSRCAPWSGGSVRC